MRAQVIAPAHTGKHGLRAGVLNRLAGRSVADENQFRAGMRLLQGAKTRQHQAHVFFFGDATNVQYRQIVRPQAPCRPQTLRAPRRVELLQIHAA